MLLIVCFGVVLEFIQPFVGRAEEAGDLAANSAGVIGGAICLLGVRLWQGRNRRLGIENRDKADLLKRLGCDREAGGSCSRGWWAVPSSFAALAWRRMPRQQLMFRRLVSRQLKAALQSLAGEVECFGSACTVPARHPEPGRVIELQACWRVIDRKALQAVARIKGTVPFARSPVPKQLTQDRGITGDLNPTPGSRTHFSDHAPV